MLHHPFKHHTIPQVHLLLMSLSNEPEREEWSWLRVSATYIKLVKGKLINMTQGWDWEKIYLSHMNILAVETLVILGQIFWLCCLLTQWPALFHHLSSSSWTPEVKYTILQLKTWWPGLWMAVRLVLTLFWYRPHCFYCANQVVLMLTSWHLHDKSWEVCIKARSPSASLPFMAR